MASLVQISADCTFVRECASQNIPQRGARKTGGEAQQLRFNPLRWLNTGGILLTKQLSRRYLRTDCNAA